GVFRGDLCQRLGQICLRVPPLRERPEDIVPLAEHFLKQTNSQLNFSGEALQILAGHRWPGNVRELRNVVTKAAVLARQLEIGPDDLLLAAPRKSAASIPV